MIKTLVLVVNASCYNYHKLITTGPGLSILKVQKLETLEAYRWKVSETSVLWKLKDEGLFDP